MASSNAKIVCEWDADNCWASVIKAKGKKLKQIGCSIGGTVRLQPEEALHLFLHGHATILVKSQDEDSNYKSASEDPVILDISNNNKKNIHNNSNNNQTRAAHRPGLHELGTADAFRVLIEASGFPAEAYFVYASLLRETVVVFRHGLRDVAAAISTQMKATTTVKTVVPQPSTEESLISTIETDQLASMSDDSAVKKIEATAVSVPEEIAAGAIISHNQTAHTSDDITATTSNSSPQPTLNSTVSDVPQNETPNAPFGNPSATTQGLTPQIFHEGGRLTIAFDAYNTTSQFSKTNPGPVKFSVAICSARGAMPSVSELHRVMRSLTPGTPLRLAVADSDSSANVVMLNVGIFLSGPVPAVVSHSRMDSAMALTDIDEGQSGAGVGVDQGKSSRSDDVCVGVGACVGAGGCSVASSIGVGVGVDARGSNAGGIADICGSATSCIGASYVGSSCGYVCVGGAFAPAIASGGGAVGVKRKGEEKMYVGSLLESNKKKSRTDAAS